MKEIVADKSLIAACGLYCGACQKYLTGKCPGCARNVKATWCKVRQCCAQKAYSSCADCKEFMDSNHCGKFNNIFSKLFGLLFNSDRKSCIDAIRKNGYENFAKDMAENRRQSIKKRK